MHRYVAANRKLLGDHKGRNKENKEEEPSSSDDTKQMPPGEVSKHEESVLENILNAISLNNYDQAKDILEKERENVKNNAGSAAWAGILPALVQLNTAEKSYYHFTFLQPKGFLRKEIVLTSVYEELKIEFRKCSEVKMVPSEKILAHICEQMVSFCSARIDLIHCYETICNVGIAGLGPNGHQIKHVPFSEFATEVSALKSKYSSEFHHPLLQSLNNAFSVEVEVLEELLLASVQVQNWKMLPALLHLQTATNRLTKWEEQNPKIMELRKNKTFVGTVFSTTTGLSIFVWLWQFKAAIHDKFSLYFHEVLARQTSSTEMKLMCSRISQDYYQKFISFQKRTDAVCVTVLLNTGGLENYQGPGGYCLPQREIQESLKGPESLQALMAYPEKAPGYWASILMLVSGQLYERNSSKNFFFIDDIGPYGLSCFVVHLDMNVVLLAAYESKKAEKDVTILGFLNEVQSSLKCFRVLAALKTGNR